MRARQARKNSGGFAGAGGPAPITASTCLTLHQPSDMGIGPIQPGLNGDRTPLTHTGQAPLHKVHNLSQVSEFFWRGTGHRLAQIVAEDGHQERTEGFTPFDIRPQIAFVIGFVKHRPSSLCFPGIHFD